MKSFVVDLLVSGSITKIQNPSEITMTQKKDNYITKKKKKKMLAYSNELFAKKLSIHDENQFESH